MSFVSYLLDPKISAQNYLGMFTRILDSPVFAQELQRATDGRCTVEMVRDHGIKDEIDWCKRVLKLNDRIVWWLKWYRLGILKLYMPEEYKKERARLGGDPLDGGYWVDFENMQPWIGPHRYAEHLFGTTACAEIQNWHPGPNESIQTALYSNLTGIERAWKESRKGLLRPKPEDQELIKFPDGWAWFLLPRHYCEDESKAMGHCGNGASSDDSQRILSLREPKSNGDWMPHCTFILEGDGKLGEMKGRNNDKPVAKYHPMIVELLKNPIVTGIQGGGYMPSHNFSMNDLTPQQREQIYAIKPQMMTLKDHFAKYGADDAFVQKVRSYFKTEHQEDIEWDAARKSFIIEDWKDLQDLIDDRGNDHAKWVISVLNGDEYSDIESGMSREDELESILNDLTDKEVQRIGETLAANYPEEAAEWREEEGEDDPTAFPTRTSEIAELATKADADDLLSAGSRAVESGNRSGMETEMHEHLESALNDSGYTPTKPDGGWWDEPWIRALSVERVIQLEDNGESIEEYTDNDDREIKFSAPYNGYGDYDENAAVEAFREEWDTDKEYVLACGDAAAKRVAQETENEKPFEAEYQRIKPELEKLINASTNKWEKAKFYRATSDRMVGVWGPLIRIAKELIPDAFSDLTSEKPPSGKRRPGAVSVHALLNEKNAATTSVTPGKRKRKAKPVRSPKPYKPSWSGWTRAEKLQLGDWLVMPGSCFTIHRIYPSQDGSGEMVVQGTRGEYRQFEPNDEVNVIRKAATLEAA